MTTRADKTLKQQKEKHHAILRELVQEPTNKTCADCLAKGPRWSSWSLGVFICIRCAGIHRNLGTHLSKVKSVDLDTWNVEQIEHILKWGNKRASEYFECYLPKDFTRPQGNHAVESFIRNKYEKKLYIMKDGEPESNPRSKLDRLKQNTSTATERESKNVTQNKRRERPEKKLEQRPSSKETILNISKDNQIPNGGLSNQANLSVNQPAQHPKSSSMNDLLSLDAPAPNKQTNFASFKSSASSDDLLSFGAFSTPLACPDQSTSENLLASNNTQSNDVQELNNISNQTSTAKSTKESILSLYSSSAMSQPQPQMYGVPGGLYMAPQQQQQNMQQQMMMQQRMNYSGYQQNAMPNTQMTQMNMQMQGMNIRAPQQQFNKAQMQGINTQQQQHFSMNQVNHLGANPSFNGQQYNMQYNNFTPNMQPTMNNFNAQPNMQSNMQSWQANQVQANTIGGMQSSGMMNSGHTMNNQLWN